MKFYKLIAILLSLVMTLTLATPAFAARDNPNSLNARFIHWQEQEQVIHIQVFNDHGRSGQPPAIVSVGQPILFGFEWVEDTTDLLRINYIDNPGHDITLSIDGGTPFSVKSGYQTPFIAATRSGPPWTWDHDADGPGDGDGDGIGDWSGPTLFFRYLNPGLTAGEHTFVFEFTFPDQPTVTDTITVDVQ